MFNRYVIYIYIVGELSYAALYYHPWVIIIPIGGMTTCEAMEARTCHPLWSHHL